MKYLILLIFTITLFAETKKYILPPEPDPKINNSTLLGIDSNNNGVRDDVERWIFKTYKDKHPIHIDIAMQMARVSKSILETPLENTAQAKLVHKEEMSAIACESYYKIYAKYFNKPLLVTEDIGVGKFESLYFNTKDRKQVYRNYSKLLSGYTFSTPEIGEGKKLCEFDTSKYD